MHLALPILFSILCSTALGLPTIQNSTLSKRRYGWVGSFQNAQCTGPVAPGDLGGIEEDTCYQWSVQPGTQYIGVNFGSGGDGLDAEVIFYTDKHCQNVVGASNYISQPNGEGMNCPSANENTQSFKAPSIPIHDGL